MKVAISVPDPVFKAAERLSKRMRMSRSEFYARAVEAAVKQHSGTDVTRQLNNVYSKSPAQLDPAWEASSLEVLRREKW